jgi:hypothetical protein
MDALEHRYFCHGLNRDAGDATSEAVTGSKKMSSTPKPSVAN